MSRAILDAAREMKQHVVEELRACIDAGDLPKTLDPLVAVRALTAGLLGVAVLRLSERLAPGENPDLLAADVLNLTLAGLRAGVTTRGSTRVFASAQIHRTSRSSSSTRARCHGRGVGPPASWP